MTRLLASSTGAPDRPPASSACFRPLTASREMVVLVAMTPSMPWRPSVAAITCDLASSRSGAIFRNIGTLRPCSRASAARRSAQRAQQRVERLVALQRAQVLGVGAGDVDRHVVGVRIDAGQADQVVVGRVLDRRRGVLADVQAQDAAGARGSCARASRCRGSGQARLLKPRPVDQRVRLRAGGTCAASGCPAAPSA